MSKQLLKQSAIYSLSKLVFFIASLISYPVLTKNLSVNEYGMVALFTITIGLMTSFMKFGIQHSIIRFKSDIVESDYISNVTFLFICIISISVFCILTLLAPLSYFYKLNIFDSPLIMYIILASAVLQAIQSFIFNILIAREQSHSVTMLSAIYRSLTLITMLVAILKIEASSFSFLKSLIIADIIFIIFVISWSLHKGYFKKFDTKRINKNTLETMLLFGIPMFGYEISNMVHAFIDRYMIEYFLGIEYLGLYSASYNMSTIISELIFGGLVIAVVPIYLRTWKEKGREETEILLSNVIRILLLLTPSIIVGLYVVSKPLLGVLATDDYKESAYLIPIITLGTLFFTSSAIYAAGLQIKKDSKKLFHIVLESTSINIVLNYLFISEYGLIAAALNTVISYLWMAIRFYFESRKILHVHFDLNTLLRSLCYAFLMYLALFSIEFETDTYTLLARILIGTVLFTTLAYIFEKELRESIIKLIRDARSR
ncbi:MAG: oligosaccharide flippase family protein [Methylococcales bacterium]